MVSPLSLKFFQLKLIILHMRVSSILDSFNQNGIFSSEKRMIPEYSLATEKRLSIVNDIMG